MLKAVNYLIVVFVFLSSGFVHAGETLVLYDDFNSSSIHPDRWFGGELSGGRETLRTILKGQLRLMDRVYGNNSSNSGLWSGDTRLNFIDPSNITTIRATVKVDKFQAIGCDANPGSYSYVSADIQGCFFNIGTPKPGNSTNDVRARIGIEASNNSSIQPSSLNIIGEVQLCTNSDCTSHTTIDSKYLGTVLAPQRVVLYMKWDKPNRRFIFQRDTKPVVYSPYTYSDKSLPGNNIKRLVVEGNAANCSSSPRPVGHVDAYFDNIYINE